MQADVTGQEPTRWSLALNRIEQIYLAVLRAATLIIATALLGYFAWLAATGAFKMSRSVKSVQEVPASVSAAEIVDSEVEGEAPANRPAKDLLTQERKFYAAFRSSYYGLFANSFQSFRKSDDKALTIADFDAAYLQSDVRLKGVAEGNLNFAEDKARLEKLRSTMEQAAKLPKTVERLKAYKSSRKVEVARRINRTRTERYCSYYGYYIDECISWDTREVPYVETVRSLQLPKGIVSYPALFGSYQDTFLTRLDERSQANRATADRQRTEILMANADGRSRLWTGLQIAGGFLVLMFFFLLIAMGTAPTIAREDRLAAGACSPSLPLRTSPPSGTASAQRSSPWSPVTPVLR